MEKRRRNPQTLTAEQFEAFRTRLDEKGNVPPPPPESYMMGEIVRGVYPQLKRLRENGYTLKMLSVFLKRTASLSQSTPFLPT